MCCRESKRICIIDYRIEHMENHMEDNDIPKFRTYRGEIEFEGTLIQADIFIDNKRFLVVNWHYQQNIH